MMGDQITQIRSNPAPNRWVVHSMKAIRLLPFAIVLMISLYEPLVYAKKADPLFRSDDLLELTVRGPFGAINRERDKEKRYPDSRLSYKTDDGANVDLDIELQVRGNFRLDKNVCRFAPLRVFFKKDQTRDTLFSKQKKLKLVTLCKPGSNKYQQYVIQEYLIYRMFNILSDLSFRVRLVHVTYVDSTRKDREQSQYGFLIENKKRLAKRLKMKTIDLHRVSVADHDPKQLNLVSVFQFFVGNTDWSVIEGETGEACCHNAKLLGMNHPSVRCRIGPDLSYLIAHHVVILVTELNATFTTDTTAVTAVVLLIYSTCCKSKSDAFCCRNYETRPFGVQ